MNDMNALAELGRQLDPPSVHPSADLRRRVMTATVQRRGVMTATVQRRRFGMSKLGWRLAGAGALAAVVTGAVLAGQVVGTDDHPPVSAAQASDVLRGAAVQAKRQPVVTVRGDQFVYVESIATSASINEGGDGKTKLVSRQRRIWLSADGAHDGLLSTKPRDGAGSWKNVPMPGCRDGKMKASKGTWSGEVDCVATPGYRSGLPTDPGAMLTYLRGQGGSKNGPDQDAFTAAGDLIREAYLPPAVLAAVFEAVGRIPGVTLGGTATDEAGRTGLAVTRNEVQGSRAELIFDSKTFDYLGERLVLLKDQDGLRAGQILNSTAVLRVAVLPTAGLIP